MCVNVSADTGRVYSFTQLHASHSIPDPYGEIVDRCARIAKNAEPGMVLCGVDYAKQVNAISSDAYISAGHFFMKGFRGRQEVWLRRCGSSTGEFLRALLRRAAATHDQEIEVARLHWDMN